MLKLNISAMFAIHGGDKHASKSRCDSLRPRIALLKQLPNLCGVPCSGCCLHTTGRKAQPSLKKAHHIALAAAGMEKPVLNITGFGSRLRREATRQSNGDEFYQFAHARLNIDDRPGPLGALRRP